MPAASPQISAKAARVLKRLGAQLRDQRRALKVSAVAAAEAAGVSRVTLHRIEKGEASVTTGAYAAVALALGLELELVPENGRLGIAPAPSFEGWIPGRVRLSRYPKLRELAWHVHGVDELTPREALDVYERNWRHLDRTTLSTDEKNLVDALREALGKDSRNV